MTIQAVNAAETNFNVRDLKHSVPEDIQQAIDVVGKLVNVPFGEPTGTPGLWIYKASFTGNLVRCCERFLDAVEKVAPKMKSVNLTSLDQVSYQSKLRSRGTVRVDLGTWGIRVTFARSLEKSGADADTNLSPESVKEGEGIADAMDETQKRYYGDMVKELKQEAKLSIKEMQATLKMVADGIKKLGYKVTVVRDDFPPGDALETTYSVPGLNVKKLNTELLKPRGFKFLGGTKDTNYRWTKTSSDGDTVEVKCFRTGDNEARVTVLVTNKFELPK